ncbi:hypothetical protein VHEMI09430 [[Torrubiella] hemipterigena]|uniref:Major facilitator superfamily (MFS) profile domain-containing protein n=1 Tax=[Torrubiella] hemipterigena TaxID=1531966 RepID=A0A0A1TGC3_9HYPO|nr:hypothetical protein VHEMI09430 [[Torrubiella] hemipterigena]
MWPVSRNTSTPPAFLALRSSPRLIIFTVAFAIFSDIFLYAVVVPVLPFALTSRVGIEEKDVQTWVSVSLAVFGGALLIAAPIWGYFADRYQNRRIPMLIGLVILVGSTVLLCLVMNIPMLIVARILQGFAGGMTWTVGLALIIDSVDPKNIGKELAWTSIAHSLAVFSGPILGGIIYNHSGYYAVYAVCFGILGFDIVMRLAIIERKDAKRFGQQSEQSTNELEPVTMQSTAVDSQAKAEYPSMDKHSPATVHTSPRNPRPRKSFIGELANLLRKPRLLAAMLGTAVQGIVQTGLESTIPLFVAGTFGWDSTGAGLIFLPLVMPTMLSPIVGALGDRYGPKWLCTSGFLLITPFAISLRFVTENSIEQKVRLCALLACIGVGLALVFSPLTAEMSWAVEEDANEDDGSAPPYAQSYGLFNVAFSVGAIIGPLLGGALREHYGFGTVGWVFGVITFVTAIVQLLWIGGNLFPRKQLITNA